MPFEETVLAWIYALVGVSLLVTSAEYISSSRTLSDESWLSWRNGRLLDRWLASGWAGECLQLVVGYPSVVVLLYLRLIAGAIILFGPEAYYLTNSALIVGVVTSLLVVLRSPFGLEGSDQMVILVLFCLLVAGLDPSIAWIPIAFLAAQLCLAYVTAGLVKLFSPIWRQGAALPLIMSTSMYGSKRVHTLLTSASGAAKVICWLLIFWEVTFPLSLLAPVPVFIFYLAIGVVFHTTNAVVMGLNNFLPSFLACYPPVISCYWWIHF